MRGRAVAAALLLLPGSAFAQAASPDAVTLLARFALPINLAMAIYESLLARQSRESP